MTGGVTTLSGTFTPAWRREPRSDHQDFVVVPSHVARGSGGRRGTEPPAPGTRRLCPPGRPGRVLVAAAGPAGAAPHRGRRARGDERHRRAGAPVPRAAAEGAL